jgi:hypothetical protein
MTFDKPKVRIISQFAKENYTSCGSDDHGLEASMTVPVDVSSTGKPSASQIAKEYGKPPKK